MKLLIAGLLLWTLVHLLPSLGIRLKQFLVGAFGERRYTIGFALLIVLSLMLIVLGWRNTAVSGVYTPLAQAKPLAIILMLVAFLLFGAAKHATRIKRFVRHPQLTSVIIWSAAHLLLNGDNRSLVLFGSLAVWAAVEIVVINQREGAWVKPERPKWSVEAKGLLISLAIFVVAVFAHPYIAGVPIR